MTFVIQALMQALKDCGLLPDLLSYLDRVDTRFLEIIPFFERELEYAARKGTITASMDAGHSRTDARRCIPIQTSLDAHPARCRVYDMRVW